MHIIKGLSCFFTIRGLGVFFSQPPPLPWPTIQSLSYFFFNFPSKNINNGENILHATNFSRNPLSSFSYLLSDVLKKKVPSLNSVIYFFIAKSFCCYSTSRYLMRYHPFSTGIRVRTAIFLNFERNDFCLSVSFLKYGESFIEPWSFFPATFM